MIPIQLKWQWRYESFQPPLCLEFQSRFIDKCFPWYKPFEIRSTSKLSLPTLSVLHRVTIPHQSYNLLIVSETSTISFLGILFLGGAYFAGISFAFSNSTVWLFTTDTKKDLITRLPDDLESSSWSQIKGFSVHFLSEVLVLTTMQMQYLKINCAIMLAFCSKAAFILQFLDKLSLILCHF